MYELVGLLRHSKEHHVALVGKKYYQRQRPKPRFSINTVFSGMGFHLFPGVGISIMKIIQSSDRFIYI